VKDLRRMVVRLGVELRSTLPNVPKAEFLLALHERFDNQIHRRAAAVLRR
jgi:hypothetical protein